MVKKFTLFELHLDDARFSNAIGGTPEEAEEVLAEMDEMDEVESEERSESGGSLGGRLRMLALAAVVAVGIRTIARRFLSEDELGEEDLVEFEADDDSVGVDVDDPVDA